MVTAKELELYRNDEVLKESELALQEYQYALNEYMYVESTIDNVLKLRLHASNIKVINESGNMDDLTLLTNAALNEAAEAADANKVSLWQKFKNFLTRLWNSIQKLFTGVDTNAFKELQKKGLKLRVSSSIKELVDAADNVESTMEKARGAGGKIAAAIAAVSTIVVGGGVGIKAWLDKKKGEPDAKDNDGTTTGKGGQTIEVDAATAEHWWNRLKNFFDKFVGKAKDEIDENDTSADQEKVKEGTSILSSLGNFFVQYGLNPIRSALAKVGIIKEKVQAPANQNGGNAAEDGQNGGSPQNDGNGGQNNGGAPQNDGNAGAAPANNNNNAQ